MTPYQDLREGDIVRVDGQLYTIVKVDQGLALEFSHSFPNRPLPDRGELTLVLRPH